MSVRSFDTFPIPLWINMAARARVRQRANDSGVTVQSIHLQTDRRTEGQTDSALFIIAAARAVGQDSYFSFLLHFSPPLLSWLPPLPPLLFFWQAS